MRWKPWIHAAVAATVLTIAGCNIFNPDGEGDAGETNLNAQAEELFRRGQFKRAMDLFDRAIRQDSTNSMAYYGYAKSAVMLYRLDRLGILNDMKETAEQPEQFAFLQHDDSTLTLRMQAASRVRRVLGTLTDRDTLTQWWRYLTDSTSAEALADTAFETRRQFITDYLVKADLDSAGYRKRSQFPLTDFRMPYRNVLVDFTAFELLYTVTRLYDFDLNDTIDHRDSLMKKLKFGNTGGFSIDSLSAIAGDLEDPEATQNMNNLIAAMATGLVGSSQLAGLLGADASSGSDSSSTESQTSANIDSVIASMGDAVLFYQFGDGLDNDGDGCIDEEILDEKDNDLDGFADEDARTIPFNRPDGVDNNLDGVKDPVNPPAPFPAGNDVNRYEEPIGDSIYPGRGYVLGWVYAYLDTAMQGGQPEKNLANIELTTWVRIKKNADPADMKIRLDLQKDSLLTKRLPNGRLPDSLGAKLQLARQQVGGCWRNLKTESAP